MSSTQKFISLSTQQSDTPHTYFLPHHSVLLSPQHLALSEILLFIYLLFSLITLKWDTLAHLIDAVFPGPRTVT